MVTGTRPAGDKPFFHLSCSQYFARACCVGLLRPDDVVVERKVPALRTSALGLAFYHTQSSICIPTAFGKPSEQEEQKKMVQPPFVVSCSLPVLPSPPPQGIHGRARQRFPHHRHVLQLLQRPPCVHPLQDGARRSPSPLSGHLFFGDPPSREGHERDKARRGVLPARALRPRGGGMRVLRGVGQQRRGGGGRASARLRMVSRRSRCSGLSCI